MHRYQEFVRKNRACAWATSSLIAGLVFFLASPTQSPASSASESRVYEAGHPIGLQDLPLGKLRDRLDQLPSKSRERALDWLSSFSFTDLDLDSLRADDEGGIYYADELLSEASPTDEMIPVSTATVNASLPVYPFPEDLKFHSRPGSTNKVYIDFDGEKITGTTWNLSLGRDPIQAVAFSTDEDFTTYSDSEQRVIKEVWQRVAEDFAPFDIDVTTEEPAVFNDHTARALITRNTDVDGQNNPSSSASGVAYANLFGVSGFASLYSPVWVYHNNIASRDYNIAGTVSHEIGHNLGLSHDGQTEAGMTYYMGHGYGETSWAPIMGSGKSRQVTQWSRGEYYLANNIQDDLSIIAGKVNYRTDDHGDTHLASSMLTITDGTNIVSTTPENDPGNVHPSNKGVIEHNTDTDIFAFTTGAGTIHFDVNPWISTTANRGGNLDVMIELRDDSGTLIAESNPADETIASISAVVAEGIYYLHIRGTGTGSPLSSTPSGYTAYASIGQYFIHGTIVNGGGSSFPPSALVSVSDITTSGQGAKSFTVTYVDEEAVDVSTIDGSDVRVSGPHGYNQAASLLGVDDPSDGSPRAATYTVAPSGSTWVSADNGVYTIWMENSQVADIHGSYVAGGELGTFNTAVPEPNVPPAVSMSSPVEGAVFTEGDAILLSASASDPDGSVVNVEFYINNIKVGEASQSPYTFTLSSLAEGEHTVYAKAFDDDGAGASSSIRSLTVAPDSGGIIAPPSNLAGTISGSTVSLSWSDNSNNEDGFNVYRGLESGKGRNKTVSWSLVATLGVNSSSYADTNVPNGTYYYYVESFNSLNAAVSEQFKVTLGKSRGGGGKGKKK